jgi:hypothetical protein
MNIWDILITFDVSKKPLQNPFSILKKGFYNTNKKIKYGISKR